MLRALVLRAEADHREVAGAAADIGDQRQFLGCHRLLVVMRRRDRLIDEGDVAKPARRAMSFQHHLSPRVRLVVVVEAHRPAMHDGGDLAAGEGFGLVLEVPHEDLDDFPQGNLAAAEAGLVVDQRGAQDRLQRTHQSAFGLADIGRDRFVAEQHATPPSRSGAFRRRRTPRSASACCRLRPAQVPPRCRARRRSPSSTCRNPGRRRSSLSP